VDILPEPIEVEQGATTYQMLIAVAPPPPPPISQSCWEMGGMIGVQRKSLQASLQSILMEDWEEKGVVVGGDITGWVLGTGRWEGRSGEGR
jgi:hypothetical protein